jgi:hypothetical protein
MDFNFTPKIIPFYCNICDIDCRKKNNYEKHLLTLKHKKRGKMTINGEDKIPRFSCKICNIKTDNKKDYEKHLTTAKHISGLHISQHEKIEKKYVCEICSKRYANASNLSKHKKKCENYPNLSLSSEIDKKEPKNKMHEFTPELIAMIMQNMQQMMIEQNKAMLEIAKNAGNNNNNSNNNNTINNDNKSFNLNFFLNERCKNAMNLSDFVNGVDISLDDFEETGRIGYVEGLSRIFCKELQKLDIYERPIHCSDFKRETIYIRENNRWEKDENKERLLRAVKQIGKKNIKVLTLWQEKYPGYKDVESKENDRYLHILTNIMCGESEEEIQSNYGKIMKNISRITIVDKNK